jgi:hypothetical protein
MLTIFTLLIRNSNDMGGMASSDVIFITSFMKVRPSFQQLLGEGLTYMMISCTECP